MRMWSRAVIIGALAAVVALHLAVVWRTAGRALDHDEGEHLRAAAWMAEGRTIYRDFAENHAPLLYQLLGGLAPPASAPVEALRSYVVSTRLLSGFVGTLAALCAAAFAAMVVAPASSPAGEAPSRRLAALGTLVPLLLVGWTSLRAFDDVRPEPYTLLLFWLGALLMIAAPPNGLRAALMLGAGLGAIAAAGVWNPKWPAESLVLFVWFCLRAVKLARPHIAAAIAAAVVPPLVVLLIALQAATLRDFTFFAFRFPAAISRWYHSSDLATKTSPFAFCSPWLRPWFVLPAALLLAAAQRSRRVLLPLALLGASALEVRFLYSYPRLWPQYFVMWACCAAVVYGLLAARIASMLRDRFAVVAAILFLIFIVHDLRFAIDGADERHWKLKEELHRRLQPGDAAWVRPEEYPMAVPAGSYYWYAFADQVPFSIEYARQPEGRGFLPPLRDEDLPPCRLLAAPGTVQVRLLDERAVRNLPRSRQCMSELARIGAIARIGRTPLWEVR